MIYDPSAVFLIVDVMNADGFWLVRLHEPQCSMQENIGRVANYDPTTTEDQIILA